MKLAILDDYQNAALGSAGWDSLGDGVDITVFDEHFGWDEDHIARLLAPFDGLVIMRERTPFPASLLRKLPNLKLLVTTGMRNLAVDMGAARAQGVTVCGTSILPYPAAELAMAFIFDLAKKLSVENRIMHEGGWQGVVGDGLNGKTLGIMGLGRLGARVARFGKALEMEVIAWSENLDDERCAEEAARLVSKEELFRQSDFLSIHTLLSERTRGLIGAAELALMKPTAYLVNTSRGPIVEEGALIDALTNGTIAGAGLDVFEVEPLPRDHPLRALDNAVLTGHIGYVVKEHYEMLYGECLEDVAAFLKGAPMRVLNAGGN